MKKYVSLLAIATLAGFVNCKSVGEDRVTHHPEITTPNHKVVVRPTESAVEIDTNKFIEGTSYKGKSLFGLPFMEDRFNSPTLLNKEQLDPYTLDAVNDAITKEKCDSLHIMKSKDEVYAFPHKWFAIYISWQTKVKGHPVKYKFLGPVPEAKADEIYANALSKDALAIDAYSPLYAAKEVKAATCCTK